MLSSPPSPLRMHALCSGTLRPLVVRTSSSSCRLPSRDCKRHYPISKAVEMFVVTQHGARIDAKDRWGATPLDEAEKNGHEYVGA